MKTCIEVIWDQKTTKKTTDGKVVKNKQKALQINGKKVLLFFSPVYDHLKHQNGICKKLTLVRNLLLASPKFFICFFSLCFQLFVSGFCSFFIFFSPSGLYRSKNFKLLSLKSRKIYILGITKGQVNVRLTEAARTTQSKISELRILNLPFNS